MSSPLPPATIKSIASALGVAHSTVSRSLRDSPLIGEDTKKRVREAARELGYVAHNGARMLRGESSALIGLVLPDIRSDFYSALTTSFAKAAAEHGRSLLLAVSQHDPQMEQSQIRALREAQVSGILIYPTLTLSEESLGLLRGVPTVQVGQQNTHLPAPFVGSDDSLSMDGLVAHLVELGHRRIGYIGSDPAHSPGRERLAQFKMTLQRLGRPFEPDLTVIGQGTSAGGLAAAAQLLSSAVRPTALMVASAPMAEGALDVITQRKLNIPADLSFTGFGDPFWYRSWGPGLTSVAMPIDQIVEIAMEKLLDPELGQAALAVRIPSRIMERRSTAAPRRQRRGKTSAEINDQ